MLAIGHYLESVTSTYHPHHPTILRSILILSSNLLSSKWLFTIIFLRIISSILANRSLHYVSAIALRYRMTHINYENRLLSYAFHQNHKRISIARLCLLVIYYRNLDRHQNLESFVHNMFLTSISLLHLFNTWKTFRSISI